MLTSQEEQRAALAASIADFIAAVEQQPNELFLRAVEGRTPRDIVAHLIDRDRGAVATSAELRRGELPACLTDPGPNFGRIARSAARFRRQLRRDAARSARRRVGGESRPRARRLAGLQREPRRRADR